MTSISIPVDDARTSNTVGGTPSDGPFPIDYPFFSTEDIVVVLWDGSTAATLTEITDYSITPTPVTDDLVGENETDADDGYTDGELSLVETVTDCTVITWRDSPIQRMADFPLTGRFNVAALNLELDRHMAIIQEMDQELQRALRLSNVHDTLDPILVTYGGVIAITEEGDLTIIDTGDLTSEVFYGSTVYGNDIENAIYYGGTHSDNQYDDATFFGGEIYGATFDTAVITESEFSDSTILAGLLYGGEFYGNTFEEFVSYGDPVMYGATITDLNNYGGTVTTGANDLELAGTIGASATSTINHAFNTSDVLVVVRETAGSERMVFPEIVFADADNIVISFASAPADGQYSYYMRSAHQ